MSRISSQGCREDLMQLLRHQTTKLLSLDVYLTSIKDRIAENNVEGLNEILQQGILPVEELNELEDQRHRLLSAYGFEYGKEGMEKCIAWCDLDNQVELQNQLVSEALSRLQHSIQTNHLLISKGKKRIRRALHLLTGQTSLQNTVTYTNNGEARDSVENRSIARA